MLTDRFLPTAAALIAAGRWTERRGVVRRVMPTFFQADGPIAARGSLCMIGSAVDALAEVIQVDESGIVLAPLGPTHGLKPGVELCLVSEGDDSPVGDGFSGRMVDGLGRPVDGGAPIVASAHRPLHGLALSPLERHSPTERLETGLRVIDTLLPLAIGQRVGIFAGSGVGKSTLIGDIAQAVLADEVIVCLVGERGREAEAMWTGLDQNRRRHTTMVVATSDQPAALRVRAAYFAVALAEQRRDMGRHVLLLLDSVTRFAMALREVGLAAGEPPTVRAYTPSVFASLPRLVERCGAIRSGGAISAIMTVLTENDDAEDPLAEVMKSILDGHIILSRELAEQGHFPAVDVPRSISRLSRSLRSDSEAALAERAVASLSHYAQARMLIESGLYRKGSQPELDAVLRERPALMRFLQQGSGSYVDRATGYSQLKAALETSHE